MEIMKARLSFIVRLLFFAQTVLASPTHKPAFPAIFAFGDSFTDTGNLLISKNYSSVLVEQYLPYGSTFFHKPTGRTSDGRLVIDFFAQRFRAPLLKPFLSLSSGSPASVYFFVDFAVSASTAQSADYLESQNISVFTNLSVGVQLTWLERLLGEAKEVNLEKALVFFGEIGYNDYNTALSSGKTYAKVLSSVPNVTAQIHRLLQRLIANGAKYIAVEGNLPMGCGPVFRQTWSSSPKDQYGCIQSMNELCQLHNEQLRKVISNLRVKYPYVSIVYLDYYEAYIEVLKRPSFYGFTNTTSACFDILLSNVTSVNELQPCPDPSQYVNWDGVHLTEAMYEAATSLFLDKGFADPYPNFLTKSQA